MAVTVEVKVEDEFVNIRYKDKGRGIAEESLNKIFDPFYTTRRGGGENTGLGLHIVYNLVNQTLKGTITCDSEEGNGVDFVIRIPKTVDEPRA